MRVIYINRLGNNQRETVDEFSYNNREERAEAKRVLNEYRISNPYAHFYFSQRATNCWK